MNQQSVPGAIKEYINYGDAGINEKGNGGEREEMGTTTKYQRGVSGG